MKKIKLEQKNISEIEFNNYLNEECREKIENMKRELVKDDYFLHFGRMTYKLAEYPEAEHIILANGLQGGFDYSYDLTLQEDILINLIIKQKVEINDTSVCYFLEKLDEKKEAYCMYKEREDFDGKLKETFVLIKI